MYECLMFIFFYLRFIVKELISEIDQDGNGAISFNEFVWLMTRLDVLHRIVDYIRLTEV